MRFQVKPSALISFAALAFLGRALLGQWTQATYFALLVSLSLLLHEVGHAVVARWHGVAVKQVGLSLIGAYTLRDKSPYRFVELQAAVAGPLVNTALALAFACFPGRIAGLLAISNLTLAVANLVPIAPSDGWRMWKLIVS
jgi:Zn-dependent protease